ncbi:MAG: hypothetical protein LBU14_03610 [Candidatus Peribacteria bacterium]|jgi:hypothetical protein|nr:hypothetical protein [Candidatus Peribacteria bacterium]
MKIQEQIIQEEKKLRLFNLTYLEIMKVKDKKNDNREIIDLQNQLDNL